MAKVRSCDGNQTIVPLKSLQTAPAEFFIKYMQRLINQEVEQLKSAGNKKVTFNLPTNEDQVMTRDATPVKRDIKFD